MDSEKLLGVEGFAPCPTCKQYSHSIGEDKLAEAFNHFHTMYAHPVRGHPMGYWFEEKTRDMAQVLVTCMGIPIDPTPENGLREALEDPGYCETSPGRWLVDDANFEPVTIIAAGNFYIGQNSADGDEVDQIVLTPEGARQLASAILSALQHNTGERE